MANHEIMHFPNMEKDYAVSGLKVIKPPKMSFKVEVDFDDKVYKQVKDDSVLHEASITLNKILDKQVKMKDEFMKEALERLGKHPGAKAKEDMKTIQSKLDAVMIDSRRSVMEQIGTVNQLHERWKKADAAADLCRPRVEKLLAMRGTDVKVFENVLYFIDLPLAALDGNAMATTAVDLAKGLGSCAANIAYDKVKGVVLDKTLLA